MGPMDTGIDSSSLVWPLEGRFSSTLIPDRYTARPPGDCPLWPEECLTSGMPTPMPCQCPMPRTNHPFLDDGPPGAPTAQKFKEFSG